MEKLLVIDDNSEILKQLRWGLGKDYKVLFAANGQEAMELFVKNEPKVVTLDLGLPPDPDGSEEGFRCLSRMLQQAPATKVIVITGRGEQKVALKAIQLGAYDFYHKPIDLNELKVILSRAFHLAALEAENRQLQSALVAEQNTQGIFGQCPPMQEVFTTIRKVATTNVSVLVLGESGTGKELVARAIHGESLRAKAPFIPINCGAIPENLLESELFGHEKGAFTGAQNRVHGKVEYAHNGTLFLDEIGELSAPLQVKLLRFLQDGVMQRVGGREDIAVDVRVIAATNVDIEKAIASGAFREDLYYRLGVISIVLPPLRERGDDVLLLANLFLHRYSDSFKKKVRGFSVAAMNQLQSYAWPGNVRELENKVKRAIIMSDGPLITPVDLGFESSAANLEPEAKTVGMSLKDAKDKVERQMVLAAIEQEQGNVAKAAETLGISRPTIYDLMKKHGLHVSTEG
ncbi:PEP-CTERM-box response regulator transcription factor [Desulfuromonas sp. AOP6]|uniref:PEP-CTERM-box response regulator transcription factor n=1 Tax=Desulfuromonas sp. AOP6 TaxID=1566351 RepID=UPI001271FDF1|nr:PEP-CTERM-box response regulator transcription factor [Desulfuromonas sp. AOP6]BCA79508.1 sigma-54-dependent Fis family transcriptional regulator [Desulfuromonas sp. AOP6]